MEGEVEIVPDTGEPLVELAKFEELEEYFDISLDTGANVIRGLYSPIGAILRRFPPFADILERFGLLLQRATFVLKVLGVELELLAVVVEVGVSLGECDNLVEAGEAVGLRQFFSHKSGVIRLAPLCAASNP